MNTKHAAEQKRKLGKFGETLACDYLKNLGYSIVEKNAQVHHKELDIIAIDKDCLVIVEVKTRTEGNILSGAWAFTKRKIANVTMAGYEYASIHYKYLKVRFDSVICQEHEDGTFSIIHEKESFYAPWR